MHTFIHTVRLIVGRQEHIVLLLCLCLFLYPSAHSSRPMRSVSPLCVVVPVPVLAAGLVALSQLYFAPATSVTVLGWSPCPSVAYVSNVLTRAETRTCVLLTRDSRVCRMHECMYLCVDACMYVRVYACMHACVCM